MTWQCTSRRLPSSMTPKPDSPRKVAVTAPQKSAARMAWAWVQTTVRHCGAERGDPGRPRVRQSSAAIRSSPHGGLLAAMLPVSVRRSAGKRGRPPGEDRQCQQNEPQPGPSIRPAGFVLLLAGERLRFPQEHVLRGAGRRRAQCQREESPGVHPEGEHRVTQMAEQRSQGAQAGRTLLLHSERHDTVGDCDPRQGSL